LELGYSEGNLCTLDLSGAVAHSSIVRCMSALSFLGKANRIAPNNPEVATALANRLGWIAGYYSNRKEFGKAARYRIEERKIIAALLKSDVNNAEYLMRYIWSLSGLGGAYAASARNDQALNVLREADGVSAKLMRLEPRSTQYQHTRLVLLSKLVIVGKAANSPDVAVWRDEGKKIYSDLTAAKTVPASKLVRERMNLWDN